MLENLYSFTLNFQKENETVSAVELNINKYIYVAREINYLNVHFEIVLSTSI